MLRTRGYADKPTLKLVGDHYQLTRRQRQAISGAAISRQAVLSRKARQVTPDALADQDIAIDGYNLLVIMESALSDAFVFRGRDGCIRDLAGMHGTYRMVSETIPALHHIGKMLSALGVKQAVWLFDAPVSNSGRLRSLTNGVAKEHAWPWEARLHEHVDAALADSPDVVISSDGWILDRAQRWVNLMPFLLERGGFPHSLIDLGEESAA